MQRAVRTNIWIAIAGAVTLAGCVHVPAGPNADGDARTR